MKSNRLADYLQVWGLDGDLITFSDASVGFGFSLSPLDVTCWADQKLNDTSGQLARFLGSLPPEIDCQFVQSIEKESNALFGRHLELSQITEPSIGPSEAAMLAHERVNMLQEQNEIGELPSHDLQVFFRLPYKKPKTAWSLFGTGTDLESLAEQELRTVAESARRTQTILLAALQEASLAPVPLLSEQLAQLIYGQWNPNRPAEGSGSSFDPDDIRGSILFSDVSITADGFRIGRTLHRVVTLKGLPEVSTPALAATLRSLPFHSQLMVSIQVPDQLKEIESLQTQRRIAYSMVFGKKTGVSDLESSAKFGDLETLLEQMISQGEKVFHVTLAIILKANDTETLDNQVAETLAAIRTMNGAEGLEESLAGFEIFQHMSIPNCRGKERMRRLKSSNLADMLPVFGPWRGHTANPRILLKNRMGGLLALDPFDASLTNANQIISGGSGSGKSFLTNLLLLQMLKENPRVFFVDIGGSYQKLCENLGGQYVPLQLSDAISINPLDLAPGEEVPSGQKIKFLVGLLELMTKEDEQERLPRLERSEIELAIRLVYDSHAQPRLSHLRDALAKHSDENMRRLGRILSAWCGDTPFGKLVDRPTSIGLGARVVAFDLKGMESYPDLQAVALYIITDLVWREVQRDRGTMKFLVFDECWKLLKSPAGLAFIEEVFRTFRKYFASAIAISQDIDDFAKSKIAGAILPNCALKWILIQQQSDKERLQQVLGLNDAEIAIVNSLHQKKGFYSEAFLMAGENHCVGVLESTPLELWIATTDPRDLGAIESLKSQQPDLRHSEILSLLAKRYPHGVAHEEK